MDAIRLEVPAWECLNLMEHETVGRLCIIEHGYPLAFPINYRVVHEAVGTRVVFRTSPNSTLARYEGLASFEVDHIDLKRPAAWSVIARGHLRRVVEHGDLPDTNPLVAHGRFQWLTLDVHAMSGRRFTATPTPDEFVVEWQAVTDTQETTDA